MVFYKYQICWSKFGYNSKWKKLNKYQNCSKKIHKMSLHFMLVGKPNSNKFFLLLWIFQFLVWPWLRGCWRKLQFHNPRRPGGGCILHSWWEWIFPKSKICKICIFDKKIFLFPQGDSIHPALARALEHLRQQNSFRRI